MADHWGIHSRQWANIGTPLRPSVKDIAYIERLLSEVNRTSTNSVLLGVTPEIACLNWPTNTNLVAVDHNPEMIARVWPHKMVSVPAMAALGDWMQLPLKDASVDVVVGDGCYTLLVGREKYGALSREVRRVLKSNGQLIMRFFVRPDTSEKIESVLDDLRNGKIGNFHVFKWRLAMALHGSFESGVAVAEVWKAWQAAGIDVNLLAHVVGWSRSVIETINAYRESHARYSFPTLSELRAALAPYFRVVSCHYPDYELGERCPTLLLEPCTQC